MTGVARLKVDYDGAVPPALTDRIGAVVRANGARVLWYALRRTRRGWHLEVETTRRWAAMRIVAAQLALGSDWRREVFNIRRVMSLRYMDPAQRGRWNVLFTRKHRVRKRRESK